MKAFLWFAVVMLSTLSMAQHVAQPSTMPLATVRLAGVAQPLDIYDPGFPRHDNNVDSGTPDMFMYSQHGYPLIAFAVSIEKSEQFTWDRPFVAAMRNHLLTWPPGHNYPKLSWSPRFPALNLTMQESINFEPVAHAADARIFFHVVRPNGTGFDVLVLSSTGFNTSPRIVYASHNFSAIWSEQTYRVLLRLDTRGNHSHGMLFTLRWENTAQRQWRQATVYASKSQNVSGFMYSGALHFRVDVPLLRPFQHVEVDLEPDKHELCVPDCSHSNCGHGGCPDPGSNIYWAKCPHQCGPAQTCDAVTEHCTPCQPSCPEAPVACENSDQPDDGCGNPCPCVGSQRDNDATTQAWEIVSITLAVLYTLIAFIVLVLCCLKRRLRPSPMDFRSLQESSSVV